MVDILANFILRLMLKSGRLKSEIVYHEHVIERWLLSLVNDDVLAKRSSVPYSSRDLRFVV